MNKQQNVAILPIGSNCRELKHPSIKLIAGIPLISFQIQVAKGIQDIGKIIVCTDNTQYAKLIEKTGGVEIVMTPENILQSQHFEEEVMLYCIQHLETNGELYDNVVLLSPINPMNEVEYVQKGLDLMKTQSDLNSIVSYTEIKALFIQNEDFTSAYTNNVKRLQQIDAGCFWIAKISEFKKKKCRIIAPYEKVYVPEIASISVDSSEKLRMVESILAKKVREDEERYYRKREYKGDFEEYYGLNYDPDGNLRDVSKERDHKIKFCKDEIKYFNELHTDNRQRKLLDVGCGVGFFMSAIEDSKWEKYGLEVSQKAAQLAETYIPNMHVGTLEKDTYEEETFDGIYSHHVIEHVPNPIPFIQNIHKILKTHGVLVMATPNFESGAAKHFGEKFRMLHDKTHISLFGDFGLKQLLEDNGFFVDRIEYPFFDTDYFTEENFMRMFDTTKISPAFYGNIMTFYARKK